MFSYFLQFRCHMTQRLDLNEKLIVSISKGKTLCYFLIILQPDVLRVTILKLVRPKPLFPHEFKNILKREFMDSYHMVDVIISLTLYSPLRVWVRELVHLSSEVKNNFSSLGIPYGQHVKSPSRLDF
jgi:hypothetical protein